MHVLNPSGKIPYLPLAMLVLSLTMVGCATTSTLSAPAECPDLPPKPARLTPAPSTPYLESARQELKALESDLQKWRQVLRGSNPTPTP